MKLKISILFLSLGFLNSYSQISFQEHLIADDSNYLSQPRSVVSADIDGDGDMDVISASYNNNSQKLGWFENINGFNEPGNINIISTEIEDISSLFAADIDGDGDIDIVGAANLQNSNVFWFENLNGLGNFSSFKIISNYAGYAKSVYVKDIDGDEDLDVVSASSATNKIAWYENLDGNGNFGSQNTLTNDALDPRSVYIEDLDNDGDNDILYSSYQNGVYWMENGDGLGNFDVTHTISERSYSESNAIAKDIDGDGDFDVIASSHSNLFWYENVDGNGDFSLEHLIETSTTVYLNFIQTADINNDGDLDIVVAHDGTYNEGKVGWFENMNGQGSFGTEQVIPNSDNSYHNSVFPVDIDNDGDIDVLSTSRDDKVRLFKDEDGLGDFDTQIIINLFTGGGTYVLAADIDNDDDIDVFSGGTKLAWFENENGGGNFGDPSIIMSGAYKTNAMYLTDIDGDGYKDLISSGTFWDEIIWHKNLNGQGDFGPSNTIYGGFGETEYPYLFVADIDGDGLEDIITESESEFYTFLSWHKKLNGEGYGERQIIQEFLWESNSIFAEDIDDDGDIDILYSDRFQDRILWYKNTDGLGNFSLQQVITDGVVGTSKLYTSDLDGDGDKDLLSASFDDNKITWYENTDGNGLFGNQQIISIEAEGATSVKAEDLDNDGDMDVVSSSYWDNKIAWYENQDGLGSFGDQEIITVNAIHAMSVTIADIDNDGDLDVLSAASGNYHVDNKIEWYENSLILGANTNNQLDLTLFPNPTSGKLKIISDKVIVNIEVFTQLGQLVLSAPYKNEIDISFLSEGIYFVQIKNDAGELGTKKIIKN